MIKKNLKMMMMVIVFFSLIPSSKANAQGLTITIHSITCTSDQVVISNNQVTYENTVPVEVRIRLDCSGDISMVNLSRVWFDQTPECPNAPYILEIIIDPTDTEQGTMEIRVWDKEKNYESAFVEFISIRGQSQQTNTNTEQQTSDNNEDPGGSLGPPNNFLPSNIGGLLDLLYLVIQYFLIGFSLTTGYIVANYSNEYLKKRKEK